MCVGTSVGTITEPDCLGPCEPGTSVTLEGIVWHETEGGNRLIISAAVFQFLRRCKEFLLHKQMERIRALSACLRDFVRTYRRNFKQAERVLDSFHFINIVLVLSTRLDPRRAF